LNPVDVLILVTLIISLGVAFLRGLVQEAMSLATWVAAVAAGYLLAEPVQPYLAGLVAHATARRVLAGALIFVLVLITGGLLNRFLSQGVRRLGLGGMDRLLGLGFGALRATALITVVVMLLQLTRLPQHEWWVQSRLLPYFCRWRRNCRRPCRPRRPSPMLRRRRAVVESAPLGNFRGN